MSDAMLNISHLNASYGAAKILFDLSFSVKRGEVVALMGRNGAGKTTTMAAIMGLVSQRDGTVQFDGHAIARLEPYQIARLGLGYVPEDRRIFSDLTVRENLDVGRQPPRRFRDGTLAPVWDEARLFKLFPNLGEMPDRMGNRMSGGEQQMLTVARTLMGNPLMILMDEPSEGVAPVIVEMMADAILELKAAGVSILLSEQNMRFAELVSDRVYVLEKGEIKHSGTMAAFAADPTLQSTYLAI